MDEYEEKFMRGQGPVLYRGKLRAPWWIHTFLLGSLGAGAVGALAAGVPALALVMAALCGAVWMNFAALRVAVSSRKLLVQYGLFGPEIPVDAIKSAEVVDYSMLLYGGKGIRFGLDGSLAYTQFGDGGRAVKIRWKTRWGITRTVVVSSPDPEAFKAAIDRARAGGSMEEFSDFVEELSEATADEGLIASRERAGLLEAPARDDLVPIAAEQGEQRRETVPQEAVGAGDRRSGGD